MTHVCGAVWVMGLSPYHLPYPFSVSGLLWLLSLITHDSHHRDLMARVTILIEESYE